MNYQHDEQKYPDTPSARAMSTPSPRLVITGGPMTIEQTEEYQIASQIWAHNQQQIVDELKEIKTHRGFWDHMVKVKLALDLDPNRRNDQVIRILISKMYVINAWIRTDSDVARRVEWEYFNLIDPKLTVQECDDTSSGGEKMRPVLVKVSGLCTPELKRHLEDELQKKSDSEDLHATPIWSLIKSFMFQRTMHSEVLEKAESARGNAAEEADDDDTRSIFSDTGSMHSGIVDGGDDIALEIWKQVGLERDHYEQIKMLIAPGEKMMTQLLIQMQQVRHTLAADGDKDKGNTFYCWKEESLLWQACEEKALRSAVSDELLVVANAYVNYLAEHERRKPKVPKEDKKDKPESPWVNILKQLKKAQTNLMSSTYMSRMQSWLTSGLFNIDPKFCNKIDAFKHLLPIEGGRYIDLKTGEVQMRTKECYMSLEIPVAWNPNADTTEIETFISQIFGGDGDKVAFIQRMLGLCLTGETKDQKIFIMYGTGSNGKSLFLKLLKTLLGSLHCTASRDCFIEADKGRSAGAANHYLMPMKGKRLAVCIETGKQGVKLDEEQLKLLAGGDDEITARLLHKNLVTFSPTAKIVLATNNKPDCSADHAIWRRLILLNFNVKFDAKPDLSKGERMLDDTLDARLSTPENMSALLKWAVEGAVAYYKGGLQVPQCIEDETHEYRKDQDTVTQFVEAMCEKVKDDKQRVSFADMFQVYTQWAKADAITALTINPFRKEIKKHFECRRISNWFCFGVKLKRIELTENFLGGQAASI